mgnify:CR=1 FL=1
MDKEKVINSLPIRDFYDNELPGIKWNGKDGKVRCCFHEDKEPVTYTHLTLPTHYSV